MSVAFDINDPSTWPDDLESLESLAEGSGDDTAETPESDSTEEPKATEGAETTDESTDSEAESGSTEGEAQEGETAEGQSAEERSVETIDGIPVLTRDGQHVIPHHVLAGQRQQVQDLKAKIAELEQQYQSSEASQQQEQSAEPDTQSQELPSEVRQKVDSLTEEWGPEIAEIYESNYRQQREIEAYKQQLESVREQTQAQVERQQRSQQSEIEDAIDNNPLMAQWNVDKDSTWMDRAEALHQTLMQTDPAYQAKSWQERFADLPGKVEAVYGASPHRANLSQQGKGEKSAPSKEEIAKQAQDQAAKAQETTPTSLSDVEGGGSPPAASDSESMQNMSSEQIQAHMESLAESPEKLEAFLQGLS